MEYRLVNVLLKDICNEIRLKDDTRDLIPNRDIAQHILDIPTRVVYYDNATSDHVNVNPNGIHDIMDGICDALRFRTRTTVPIPHSEIPQFINHKILVHFDPVTTEHLEISNAQLSADLMRIYYKETAYTEHISVSNASVQLSYIYANSSVILSVENIESTNQPGEWGKTLKLKFDYPIYVAGKDSLQDFVLTDSLGKTFNPIDISISADTNCILLDFSNFNTATGVCILKYTKGKIQCAVAYLNSFDFSFTPVNLIPPIVDPPIPVLAYNSELGGNE